MRGLVGQKSEGRSRKVEGGRWKSEVGSQMLEGKAWRTDGGNVEGWRSNVRGGERIKSEFIAVTNSY